MSQYEEFYFEMGGDYYREIPTSSFLAGILFCKNEINFLDEYPKLKEDFERIYMVSVVGPEDLAVELVVQGTSIRLMDDYNKIIKVHGKVMNVRSYLYSLTTVEVRDYFDIQQPRNNTLKNYWNYLFNKKRKTK